MTDKEKLDKFVAEIERLKKIVDDPILSDNDLIIGERNTYMRLLSFYNSMQKEPKECMYSKDNYTDEDRKALCDGCEEECKFNKKEEPVSDDLEGEINRYLSTWSTSKDNGIVFCEKMARHFAAWQKQQLMAKAVGGVVHRFDGCGVASVHYNDPNGIPMAYFIPSEGLSAGDKVKIITIKED